MKKYILIFYILLIINTPKAFAEQLYSVAVMDFSLPQGISSVELAADGSFTNVSDCIVNELINDNHFLVIDKELYSDQLISEKIKTSGIIDQKSAQRIGELMGIRYIIYGNVTALGDNKNTNEIKGIGLDMYNVNAKITLRMMDIQTGKILIAVKGEGSSESSSVKASLKDDYGVHIGVNKVSSINAYNAIIKATINAVERLKNKLFIMEDEH